MAATNGRVPAVRRVPGRPHLNLGAYDLAELGYEAHEFFLSGEAAAYRLAGDYTPDGLWEASPAGSAPYVTRIVVVRPIDVARFDGTVVLEWLNVSAGGDTPADWIMAHRELARTGVVWAGVSAQSVGIEGGVSIAGTLPSLKAVDPGRYGGLNHPGDPFGYDIYAQAARALRQESGVLLEGLAPERLIGAGESQSAIHLTTYINGVEPLTRAFDGFLVHSRYAAAASLEEAKAVGAPVESLPQAVRFRADRRAPVMAVITETDLVLGRLGGYWQARQPNDDRLRVWEIAGTAHGDNYVVSGGFIDSGKAPLEALARSWEPSNAMAGGALEKPINFAPQHHYVVQAAFRALDRWLRTGEPPPAAEPLALTADDPPELVLDELGLARGGIRTPWVDVPTARLSGVNRGDGLLARLFGEGERFDAALLERLYPSGLGEYLVRFEAALDDAIAAGFILVDDRREILDLAALAWRRGQA